MALLGRPLGYLIFSLMAFMGTIYTNIFQWVLGANLALERFRSLALLAAGSEKSD